MRATARQISFADWELMRQRDQGIRLEPLLEAISCFLDDQRDVIECAAEAAHYCGLWIAFAVALVIYSYVLATLRMPMWDQRFARMDAALGFNWSAGVRLGHVVELAHPFPARARLQQHDGPTFVSLGFFAIIGRADRNRELLWIGMLAVVLAVTLSGPFPALGPYTTGGMPEWSSGARKNSRRQPDENLAGASEWNRGLPLVPRADGSAAGVRTSAAAENFLAGPCTEHSDDRGGALRGHHYLR